MPTYERSDSFKKDYKSLGPEARALVKAALTDFIADLTDIERGASAEFRPGLRVKSMKDNPGIWEMSWDGDGRATFDYGPPADPEHPARRHVRWRRIGTHAIFAKP